MQKHILAALVLTAFLAALAAPVTLSPPTNKYCAPIAFRDRVVAVGYQAVVRAAPGCKKPAKVRKENTRTGSIIGEPNLVPVGEVQRVWLFTHRLRYTLDDRTWLRLEVH